MRSSTNLIFSPYTGSAVSQLYKSCDVYGNRLADTLRKNESFPYLRFSLALGLCTTFRFNFTSISFCCESVRSVCPSTGVYRAAQSLDWTPEPDETSVSVKVDEDSLSDVTTILGMADPDNPVTTLLKNTSSDACGAEVSPDNWSSRTCSDSRSTLLTTAPALLMKVQSTTAIWTAV